MKAELRKLQDRLWGRLKGVLGDEKNEILEYAQKKYLITKKSNL
jgi:hypothetical protein